MPLVFTALQNIPLIRRGDDLSRIILKGLTHTGISLSDDDILVITQKIISKSEGRTRRLSSIVPSPAAIQLASRTGKDPRLVELILAESTEILREGTNVVICKHKTGLVCPNAGIDQANISKENAASDKIALLLPEAPDVSAHNIRKKIEFLTGKQIGVLIIDSLGRPWRKGSVGTCIGLSGVPAIVNLRGRKDLFGRVRRGSRVAVADELAAGASLVMGQTAERCPVVHVSGFPYPLRESSLEEIFRSKDKEVFR